MLPTLCRCAKAVYTQAPSAKHTFKRAQKGLFGGKVKLFGNNVPESHHKTRRTWLPNVQTTKLYSATLNERIKMKVTVSALRDIDKVGGLDEYLLKPTFEDVLGETGRRLRLRVLKARKRQQTVSAAPEQPAKPKSKPKPLPPPIFTALPPRKEVKTKRR